MKARSHTAEKRISMHPHKPHATSQPSRFSHTPRLRTFSFVTTVVLSFEGFPGLSCFLRVTHVVAFPTNTRASCSLPCFSRLSVYRSRRSAYATPGIYTYTLHAAICLPTKSSDAYDTWGKCYTEDAPNAWHRRGTQKTGHTYNQPNHTTHRPSTWPYRKGSPAVRTHSTNQHSNHPPLPPTPNRVITRFSQPTQPAAKHRRAEPHYIVDMGEVCYAVKAWHRRERQEQWHKRNHQPTNHAATKQPKNNTKPCTPVIRHNTHQTARGCPPCIRIRTWSPFQPLGP